MNQNIFSCRIGSFEVFMLVEHQGPGNPGILLDADPALVKRYIPTGTYNSGVNAFLLRDGKRIILFDTGFGGQAMESMKGLNVLPKDITAVLITHLHGDHYSGLEKDGKAFFPAADVLVAEKERDFWVNTDTASRGGPGKSAADVLAPYGNRVKTFSPGTLAQPETLFPGVGAVAACGHTPGHTAFLIESGDEKLLITGDMIHVGDVQFPAPDISVSFDTDPAAARSSRRELLAWAAAGGAAIGGMHLAFPAVGRVKAEDGGYAFLPAH
ncbi:MAG: MBL fold metallo-hydrolase [Treponema sp.]|jgi:glyoxylase-like metal-dependent hydrolase (beta-lactamase superfamily II)|nr:MBL fold metallo-hydrolase [Treponema sp.]